MVIVPWQVGMQPPMEGTPMSLKPSVEDHVVTMVICSTVFTFLPLCALRGAHQLIQKSPVYSGISKLLRKPETIKSQEGI